MPVQEGYFDPNQELYRRHWETAQDWDTYLAGMEEKHRERWLTALDRTELSSEQAELIGSFTRKCYLLCLSGAWCGDCVREGPIFKRIADAAPQFELRFVERDINEEMTDHLRVIGAKKVPVVVFLTEDFFEAGRFGDRTLSVYRRKAETELGPACAVGSVPPQGWELAAEIQDWVDLTEWMHLLLRTSAQLRKRYAD